MNKNWLSTLFDWLGNALESFNPSAFRFLAAVLPYLTPIPVAWLTANSSAQFLHFTPQVSFVFVFALEGIGLWFTTMFVDAVVDFVRSRNWKSLIPVIMFALTVTAYVEILVSLNVTLEQATGNSTPALSKVITLLCFLPLITGVGNGYYKLKLEYKTQAELDRERNEAREERIRKEKAEQERLARLERLQEERLERQERLQQEEKVRQERSAERLERLRIKAELSKNVQGTFQKDSDSDESFQERSSKVESWRKVKEKLSRENLEELATMTPEKMRQYASQTGLTYKTISNWKNNAKAELEKKG